MSSIRQRSNTTRSIERRDFITLLGSGGGVDKHPTEPKSFVKRGRHRLPPHKCHRLVDRLLVVSDAAAQFADPGYEAHLRYRLCVGAWPWKHVADFGDLTFRLLRRSIEFLTIYIAGWILQGSNIRASWNGRRTREGLSIHVSETERI